MLAVLFFADDLFLFQHSQPVGQQIGGNAFG
jgi:hypothetical protein